jgi:hypothetical protein
MKIADDINTRCGGIEMDNNDILRIAMQQQSIDLSCKPEDFRLTENKVVISEANPKARSYLTLPVFCNFASFGNNIVASVSVDIAEFVSDYISGKTIEDCFTVPNFLPLTMNYKSTAGIFLFALNVRCPI